MLTPVTRVSIALPPVATAVPKPRVITPGEFPGAIGKGRVVVEFFSYGCGYCRRAKPEVDAATAQLAGEATVLMLSVDDPMGKLIGMRHGLSYYPTFAVFEDAVHVGTFCRQGATEPTAAFIVDRVRGLLKHSTPAP